jgi:hypothetical protein
MGARAELVEPHKWKGSTPKNIHQPRILKCLDYANTRVLEDGLEGVAVSKQHNVVDAVGLGLWRAGVLAR